MTERILISSMINGTELLRSLALRQENSFAFRVLSPAALAETALIRCGMLPKEKRLRLDEQRVIIGGLMQQAGSYFAGVFSFQDAANLTDALNEIRLRVIENEAMVLHDRLLLGEFKDKNTALLEIYDQYTDLLRKESRLDDIGLIRFALSQAAGMPLSFCGRMPPVRKPFL